MKVKPETVANLTRLLAKVCPPELMRLERLEIFEGPSPFAPCPAVVFGLETGPLQLSAADLYGRLQAAFPAHFDAGAGDLPRARKANAKVLGASAARLAARLLSSMLIVQVADGTGQADDGASAGWVERHANDTALAAIRLALLAVGSALNGLEAAAPGGEYLAHLKKLCDRDRPNNESRVLIAGARRRNLPVLQINRNHALWQFGWGCRSERFWVTSSNGDGLFAQRISGDKHATKRLLVALGMPTPKWAFLRPGDDVGAAARVIGWPCVAKPFHGGGGLGVTADIRDQPTLERAVALAGSTGRPILIESHEPGDDFRLMVIDGKLEMAVRLDPPSVVGDGTSTLDMLIAGFNASRKREADEGGYRKPVPIDAGLDIALASQSAARDTIVAKGRKILLRTNANHGTGGTCTDVLDQVHPQIRFLAERVAEAIGFRVTGIDYITTDITKSHDEVGGGVIEVNATPGMEVLITAGIVPDRLAELVLGDRPGRIPVCLVLASAEAGGKIVGLLDDRVGPGIGLVSAKFMQIGGQRLPRTALPFVDRVAAMLRYPALESLIVIATPEEVELFGLPVDAVDAAVILGKAPPRAWNDMLARHSGKMLTVKSAAAAAEAALSAIFSAEAGAPA
ncbi:MAG TPA: hypothetical protein VJR87_07640 [Allosphingosinicella sp.]|nr:hypothetical protein [Allosphingosinicella sp.]